MGRNACIFMIMLEEGFEGFFGDCVHCLNALNYCSLGMRIRICDRIAMSILDVVSVS